MLTEEIVYYATTLSSRLKFLELYILSDPHYGNPFCDIKNYLRQLDYIANTPNAYAIFNGDLCESSLRTSKGEIYRQVGTPQDQRDWHIEKLLPLKDKILGMTRGNHEDRIYHEVGIDICKDIAQAIGCPYDPDGIYLKLSFGDYSKGTKGRPWVYWIYATHGYGGARTKAAKAVKVERLSTWLHADIYAMSHDHVVNISPDVYLMPDPRTIPQRDDGKETGFRTGKVVAHRKELIKTNAFIKWGGYSRAQGFPPTDLVTPTILLGGKEKPWFNAEKNWKPEIRVLV